MSEKHDINNLENRIREVFSEWIPPYQRSEVESDWQQVQDKMSGTPSPGSGGEGGGLAGSGLNWMLGGIALVAVSVSTYFLITQSGTEEIPALVSEEAEEAPLPDPVEKEAAPLRDRVEERTESGPLKDPQPEKGVPEHPQDIHDEHAPGIPESSASDEDDSKQASGDDTGPKAETDPGEGTTESEHTRELHSQGGAMADLPPESIGAGEQTTGYSERKTDQEEVEDSIYCNQQTAIHAKGHVHVPPGTYKIPHRIDTVNGTADTVFRTLIVTEPVMARFEIDNKALPEVSFKNKSSGAEEYEWHFGDGRTSFSREPEHYYSDTGSFEVTLIASNKYDCRDTAAKEIGLYPEPELQVPNVFTPDGSGMNEEFLISIEGEQHYELHVFDRSGKTVFHSRDKNDVWDGTCKPDDKPCPTGTYFYTLRYKWMGDDEMRTKQGEVYLLR